MLMTQSHRNAKQLTTGYGQLNQQLLPITKLKRSQNESDIYRITFGIAYFVAASH
jgi:hypothetical protein